MDRCTVAQENPYISPDLYYTHAKGEPCTSPYPEVCPDR